MNGVKLFESRDEAVAYLIASGRRQPAPDKAFPKIRSTLVGAHPIVTKFYIEVGPRRSICADGLVR